MNAAKFRGLMSHQVDIFQHQFFVMKEYIAIRPRPKILTVIIEKKVKENIEDIEFYINKWIY
jgi:hypothetical protein